jgi:5-methylcytosine-specific restriction enzyme subunit McrC
LKVSEVSGVQATCIPEQQPKSGFIGRIPVRNLWLLMLYASGLFRHIGKAGIAVEDNPDDIPDLVAQLLARFVEKRLARNLSFGYQSREATLGRVRGRINLLYTERHQLLERGKVACRFEELTVDTLRNRYVRAALDAIAPVVGRADLAHKCRSLSGALRRMGVVGGKPGRAEMSSDRFGRHDAADQQMVAAAHLAFDLALPTETEGNRHLSLPDREIVWIRKLYEKGVAGFYEFALFDSGWRVHAGKTIGWHVESQTDGIDRILPVMRTDIVLDHVKKGLRIVIDTKFNSIVTKGWYKEETLRSSYLYQMYAYLRSQEGCNDQCANSASGILLHPSVGAMVNEAVVIQGHEIRFATVDLAGDALEIRRQLIKYIQPAQ